MPLILLIALMAAATAQNSSPPTSPDTTQTVRTIMPTQSTPSPNAEGPELQDVKRALLQHDFERARSLLKPMTDACEARDHDAAVPLVNMADDGEYTDFTTTVAKGRGTNRAHDDCPGAYRETGYLMVERGEKEEALRYLDKATTRAPYWSLAWCERGFVQRQSGDLQGALASYSKALDLASRFESERGSKAAALRGIGFAQTELGRLDEAQKAYEDALAIEPGNELARHELEYIAQLRQRKSH